MSFILHNSFEIVCGRQRKIIYNTVLPDVNTKFLNGENYTDFLAFGSGVHASVSGITELNNPVGIKQSTLTALNTDISKNFCYLRKSVEFSENEYNGITIRELGLTSNSNGQNLFNYASIADGVTKIAGEKLIITATVYFICFSDSLCGGNNPLFEVLFGLKRFSDFDIKLIFSDGEANYAALIRKDCSVLASVDTEVSISDNKFFITGVLPQNCYYHEALLTFDKIPVCFVNTKTNNSSAVSISKNTTARYGAFVANQTDNVVSVTQNNISLPFQCKKTVSSAYDVYKNPFGIILKQKDRVFTSYNGNHLAVCGGDELEIYDLSNGNFKKITVNNMNFAYRDIENILFTNNGNMILRLNKAPFIRAYYRQNNTLQACSGQQNYDNTLIYDGLCEYDNFVFHYYISYSNGTKHYRCYSVDINNNIFDETLVKEQQGDIRHFYSPDGNSEIIYDSSLKTTTVYPQSLTVSETVKSLLPTCSEAVICGGFILIKTGNKLRLLELNSGNEHKIYDSGVRRAFYSKDGIIVKLYANNKMKGIYADGSCLRLTEFDINKRVDGEIVNISVFKRGIVVTAKTRFYDCYYLPFAYDDMFVFAEDLATESESEVAVCGTKNCFYNQSGNRFVFEVNLLQE